MQEPTQSISTVFGAGTACAFAPRFEHFSKQAFSESEWEQIFAPLKARGVKIYADVFGLEAMKIAAGSDIAGVKIHSSDLADLPLLEAAAGWGRLILGDRRGTARRISGARHSRGCAAAADASAWFPGLSHCGRRPPS